MTVRGNKIINKLFEFTLTLLQEEKKRNKGHTFLSNVPPLCYLMLSHSEPSILIGTPTAKYYKEFDQIYEQNERMKQWQVHNQQTDDDKITNPASKIDDDNRNSAVYNLIIE
jgi:hypothetical protein